MPSPTGVEHASLRMKLAAALTHRRGFLIALGGYFLLLFVIRLAFFPGATIDEAEELLFAQDLRAGYVPRNPPLFTWLLIGVESIAGVSAYSPLIVRLLLLFAAYALLHAAARHVLRDDKLAVLAALSPMATYFVGLRLIKTYSHSAAVVAACVVTFYALVKVRQSGRLGWFILLGAASGLGLLTKYNFTLFLASLLIAALMDQELRSRLLSLRGVLVPLVALATLAPHLVWLKSRVARLIEIGATRFELSGAVEASATAGLTAYEIFQAFVSLSLPLVPILFFFFWRTFLRDDASSQRDAHPVMAWRRVLGRSLLIQFVGVVILAFALGLTRLRVHYLAIFILFPLWFFALIRTREARVPLRGYARTLAAAILLVPLLIAAGALEPVLEPERRHDMHVQWESLAGHLRVLGFSGGTIIADDSTYRISGNLRPYFPESEILSTRWPEFDPWEGRQGLETLVVWSADDGPEPPGVPRYLESGGTIQLEVSDGEGRPVRFGYAIFPRTDMNEMEMAGLNVVPRLASEVVAIRPPSTGSMIP